MRRFGILAVALSFCVSPGFAASVTIDFDDLPTNSLPIPRDFPDNYNEYVVFSTEPGAQLIYFSQAGVVGTSAPNTITAAVDPNAFPYSADVYLDFASPADNLSFKVSSDNDAGEIARIRVFHALSNLTDEVPVVGDGNLATPISIDLTSFEKVTRIEIVEVIDEFGLSYDDFQFETSLFDVPEPSSWVLALLAASVSRRRTRRAISRRSM